MTEKEIVLYEWLKAIDPKVLELDRVPLGGSSPSFPWEEFSQKISQAFQIENLKINQGEIQWLEAEKLYKDLGDNLFTQQATLSTFEGKLFFVIDIEDLRYLMYALLTQKPPSDVQIFDEELEQGFYRYLSLEAVRCFSEIDFDQTLSPHLLKGKSLPDKASLGVGINISLLNRSITARLLIEPEFLRSWREHYSERTLSTPISHELLSKLEVPMHLEIGKVQLTKEELKSLKLGDLLLLDQCYFDPDQKKGQVVLSLNGSPKLRGSLEKNHIKITDSPLFHEDINPLVKGAKDNE